MKKDFFSSLFLFLFATYFAMEAYHFGLGKIGMPGPGYFPFGVALLFGICSLMVFITSFKKKASQEGLVPRQERLQWWNIVLVMAAMFVYTLFFNRLGFVISTFLLFFFLIRVVAHEPWFFSTLASVSAAFASHLLFNVLLNAQLPVGILKF